MHWLICGQSNSIWTGNQTFKFCHCRNFNIWLENTFNFQHFLQVLKNQVYSFSQVKVSDPLSSHFEKQGGAKTLDWKMKFIKSN